jgi:hypothetical protein
VIKDSEVVTPVKAGQQITAPMDGWFLSDAEYLRIRRAIKDRIMELKATNAVTH